MNITSLVRHLFVPRMKALEKYQTDGELLQRKVLHHLLTEAKNTEYGRKYAFSAIKGYDDFAKHCPVNTYEELKEWYARSGLPLKRFFNTSGLLYKSMELKTKLPNMTDEEMLALLAADGMLVKRPLAIGDDFVLVGFKEAEWVAKLK